MGVPLPEIQKLPVERAKSRGVTILYATKPGGTAIESPELGHGYFTYYVAQAFADFAKSTDATLTVGKLADSVSLNVQRRSNSQQVPTLLVHPDDEGLAIASR
jgi:uncharacterized caspase-like protein